MNVWNMIFLKMFVSDAAEIQEDVKRSEQFVQMLFTLQQYAGDTVNLPSSGELLEMFGKVRNNCYNCYSSYDVASGSEKTPSNKIDKPLVVYRFSGNFMTSITTLHT